MPADLTSSRFLLAAATAALILPAAAWAGSLLDLRPPAGPDPAAAAADPFAFTYGHDAPAGEPLRPSLLDEATPAPRPAPAVVVPDAGTPDYGPQVVPLPPALYPGLVLLGAAHLRMRKS